MRDANTILGIIQERGKRGLLPVENAIRLFTREAQHANHLDSND